MKDGDELFRFGALRFNIEKLKKLISEKPRDPVGYEIVPWAETFLALRRDNPTARPHSIFMRINYGYLDSIDEARLAEPIILVEAKKLEGWLVVDGNHRVAKAYLAGIDFLPAYMVREKEANLCRG
jgi:hypothetical protein